MYERKRFGIVCMLTQAFGKIQECAQGEEKDPPEERRLKKTCAGRTTIACRRVVLHERAGASKTRVEEVLELLL